MNSETKTCQSCKTSFTIEPEDFAFYERIKVPAPTLCPQCRNIRRLAWREDRTLYKDTCDLCKKDIVSVYAPDSPCTVYCQKCWYSDKWDAGIYARDYDFSRPFFEQFRELLEVVPRAATTGEGSVGCEYSHGTMFSKNCYLTFGGFRSEDCMYSMGPVLSRNVIDSFGVFNGNQVYENAQCDGVFQTKYCYFANECIDSAFLFDCTGCNECFGCFNLRSKTRHIFNKPYSKEDYKREMQKWDLGSYRIMQEAIKKFSELVLATPHRYAFITNSQNVTGDSIQNSKNCQNCFHALDGVQNCKYVYYGGLNLKDSMDVTTSGDLSEIMYESMANIRSSRTFFSARGTSTNNVQYCEGLKESSNCFGSAMLKNKKYCILNKQYSEEEYKTMLPKIIAHMGSDYGEFFPMKIALYPYNETMAFSYYPLTEEEALKRGYTWRESPKHEYIITLKSNDLPDHIRDVQDAITKEIIGCGHEGTCNHQCITAFRFTQSELDFYRKMNIALPRLCHNCRHGERLKWRNGFTLYHRKCARCPNEFETTYAPDRPEIIYCDRCYKDEFL